MGKLYPGDVKGEIMKDKIYIIEGQRHDCRHVVRIATQRPQREPILKDQVVATTRPLLWISEDGKERVMNEE